MLREKLGQWQAPQQYRAVEVETERLWEGLYEQHGSPELREELLRFPYPFQLHRLSAEQKLELLIRDMQENLAFSSPDERAKSHADWECDLETPSCDDAFYRFLRGEKWSWESWMKRSKRRRAAALSRLDTEFNFLALQSTELYLADGEAFADIQTAAVGDGGRVG